MIMYCNAVYIRKGKTSFCLDAFLVSQDSDNAPDTGNGMNLLVPGQENAT